jgi:hypothetical protein
MRMKKSSTLRMVLGAGGIVGAIVVALLIKEHFFDRRDWVEVDIVGLPCADGVLDQTLYVKLSGDGFMQAQSYSGGASGGPHAPDHRPLHTMIPADAGEIRAEIGVCKQVNTQTVDCRNPTWLGGHQIVKLDRTTKPAQVRVMFPGDLACRTTTAQK